MSKEEGILLLAILAVILILWNYSKEKKNKKSSAGIDSVIAEIDLLEHPEIEEETKKWVKEYKLEKWFKNYFNKKS